MVPLLRTNVPVIFCRNLLLFEILLPRLLENVSRVSGGSRFWREPGNPPVIPVAGSRISQSGSTFPEKIRGRESRIAGKRGFAEVFSNNTTFCRRLIDDNTRFFRRE